jgi:hypothetical protein
MHTSFNITIVFGVILLFIGIGIQPAFAEVPIESENSELVEITVQFYEIDKSYNHTVLITTETLQDLENLKDNFKEQINSSDNPIETELIFKNTILSLNELGLLPKNISVNYAQNLVIGKKQDPWIINTFEKWANKEKESFDEYKNILYLIAGDSNRTSFAGPVPILLLIHYIIIINRINTILDWVSESSKFGELLSNIFKELFREIYQLRLYFWLFLGAGINFFPLKSGAIIAYGFPNFDPFSYDEYPAEGWVYTIGLSGKQIWSGSFWGLVLGFTGIKIIREYFDFIYLGAALRLGIYN